MIPHSVNQAAGYADFYGKWSSEEEEEKKNMKAETALWRVYTFVVAEAVWVCFCWLSRDSRGEFIRLKNY